MPDGEDQRPDNTQHLIRGCDPEHIGSDQKVKKSAFIPRRNGKDDGGISVSLRGGDTDEQLRVRMRQPAPLRSLVQIGCGVVRDISIEDERPLDVLLHPTPEDPLHCLITGMPTGKDPEEIARATRLAQLLAKSSMPL